MPTVNATHRKRLARALAAALGIPYATAREQVTRAAAAGTLPSRLDEAGMQAALRILTDQAQATKAEPESSGTERADVRSLLQVRDAFLAAGRVQWWWHTGPFAGSHGFKAVEGIDEADGSLVLRDEDPTRMEPGTTLALDYLDDPDKAARHLVWTDRSGVTFCDKRTGEADATYKVAPSTAPRQHQEPSRAARPNAATRSEANLLALLEKTGGRTQVAGIVECRAALALAARGMVRIESGTISAEGGSGTVSLTEEAIAARRELDAIPEGVRRRRFEA